MNIYKCTLTWEHPPEVKDTSLLSYCVNITKQGAPVQEVCVKATQYSFAMSSMDWCGTYEVTSATKCNTAVSNTYRETLTPVGMLQDLSTYRNTNPTSLRRAGITERRDHL